MRITKSVAVSLLCAATSAGVLAGVGPAAAAQQPEAHIRLIGSTQAQASWDTHGRTGCVVIGHEGAVASSINNIPTTGAGPIFTVKDSGSLEIVCPGGTRSAVARLYGPRSAINDARTNFNDDTNGAFGS